MVVDGSSLAVAIMLNNNPKGTTQVLLRGKLTKVAIAIVFGLSQRGIKIWLVGNRLAEQEQLGAAKGTIFVPFSQFPSKKLRRDCYYHCTPAMKIPKSLENVYSCENWLPRRVMSAWRIAGIVHALEGWNEHECGYTMSDIVWEATLRHGFQPLITTTTPTID